MIEGGAFGREYLNQEVIVDPQFDLVEHAAAITINGAPVVRMTEIDDLLAGKAAGDGDMKAACRLRGALLTDLDLSRHHLEPIGAPRGGRRRLRQNCEPRLCERADSSTSRDGKVTVDRDFGDTGALGNLTVRDRVWVVLLDQLGERLYDPLTGGLGLLLP